MAHRDARSTDAVHPRLHLDLLAEHDRRAEVQLDACQDQRHPLERLVRLEDVEEVPDPGQLDVAEEDGVVDMPERVGVAKAHLQGRAVTKLIGHGAVILRVIRLWAPAYICIYASRYVARGRV